MLAQKLPYIEKEVVLACIETLYVAPLWEYFPSPVTGKGKCDTWFSLVLVHNLDSFCLISDI